MSFNINDFKSRGLTKGGARPSLFQVVLFPNVEEDPEAIKKFVFTCRASEIPAATIEAIPVPYFGRQIKLAGDRTFADWNVTVMNDEDYLVRNMFEYWSNRMNELVGNRKTLAANSYKNNDAIVTHYSKDSTPIRQYKFVGLFPISVGAMTVDWDATNTIQTFDVTFAYDYWVPIQFGSSTPIITGDPGFNGVQPTPNL